MANKCKEVYYWQRKKELITFAETDYGVDETDTHHIGVDPHNLKYYYMSGGGCSCWDGSVSESEFDSFEELEKEVSSYFIEIDDTSHRYDERPTSKDISFFLLEARANYEIFRHVFEKDTDVEKFIMLAGVFNKDFKHFHRIAIDTASLESVSIGIEIFLEQEWQEIKRFNLSPKGIDKMIDVLTEWKTRERLIELIN